MGREEKRVGGVREEEREGRGEEGGRSEQEMRRSSRGTGQRTGWGLAEEADKGRGQGEAPFSVVPSAQVLPTTPHQLGSMLGCFIIIIGIIYLKN